MIHHSIKTGNNDSNHWIVLIHGLSCDATDWAPLVSELPQDSNTVLVDLRGHGHSASLPAPFTMQQLALDVVDILGNLPPEARLTLAGHSMGTRVALEVSNHLHEQVEHLVFVDGSRQATPDSGPLENLVAGHFSSDEKRHAFVRHMFGQMFAPHYAEQFGNAAVQRALDVPGDTLKALMLGLFEYDCNHLPEALDRFNQTSDAKLTVLQSTSVNENKDRAHLVTGQTVPYLEFIAGHVPRAKLQIVEDTGHFIQLERPGVIAEFLVGGNSA